MKTILYATDCTKKSIPQLKYAYKLSKLLNAKLHVLHVYDLLPLVSANVRSRGILEKNFETEQKEVLEKYCIKNLKKEFGIPEINYHANRSESISEAIIELTDTLEADLVLVGVKNPYSLRGIFTENIANELMNTLACPMLILPDYALFQPWTKLMYATDFEASDVYAIESLAELASEFDPEIEVIHIPRQEEDYYNRKMEWFKSMIGQRMAYSKIVFSCKRAQDVETGIQDFIEKDQPDVLVMMERQRESFLDQILHKDLVKTMEHEIDIPLLVFNKKMLGAQTKHELDQSAKISMAT